MGLLSNTVSIGRRPFKEIVNIIDGDNHLDGTFEMVRNNPQFEYLGACFVNGELVHGYRFHDDR